VPPPVAARPLAPWSYSTTSQIWTVPIIQSTT